MAYIPGLSRTQWRIIRSGHGIRILLLHDNICLKLAYPQEIYSITLTLHYVNGEIRE